MEKEKILKEFKDNQTANDEGVVSSGLLDALIELVDGWEKDTKEATKDIAQNPEVRIGILMLSLEYINELRKIIINYQRI